MPVQLQPATWRDPLLLQQRYQQQLQQQYQEQQQSPYAGYETSTYGGADPGTIPFQPFLDYGEQIMDLALDPQQEIFNREQQRLQQQTRAGLEQRGLNLSGVGAGIEADVMSDFALDWQNQLLDRGIAGAGAYGQLGGQAQRIAESGFRQAGELGASAFQYQQPTSTGSTFTYQHLGSVNPLNPDIYKTVSPNLSYFG